MKEMLEKYVLIVDDDPDAQEILSTIVGSLGPTVGIASDGEEALACIGARIPDLVLLDLMMPNLDGFQTLARLRSTRATRHIPVVVVTAYSVGQSEWLRLPGVKEIIQKANLSVAKVKEMVTAVLASEAGQSVI